MSNEKDDSTDKAKPQGRTDPETQPNSPDIKQEGWSAEEIAEQASNKDAAEVKEEIKQGQKTQHENG